MIPIAAAAMMGVPIVDGDAMGRAFPEAQMVTFHLAGYGPGTTVLVDHHGNEVVTRPVDGTWSERLARSVTIEMGGAATMIDYAYDGGVVRECAIAGTLSLAHRIGAILQGQGAAGIPLHDDEKIDALCAEIGGVRVFDGKVTDLERRVVGGFTRGAVELAGVANYQGRHCRLDFQNEILLARRDGLLAAVTPDLIAVLDLTTGTPITTDAIRFGARVAVIAIPCDDRWRTPMGLATAGPAHFGYDLDWVPVEQLTALAAAQKAEEKKVE
jgi:DUF917 family protein